MTVEFTLDFARILLRNFEGHNFLISRAKKIYLKCKSVNMSKDGHI
jgi:hypothetical protein